MKVDEIFTRLSIGYLSNLSMTTEGSGTINTVNNKNKIIGYINEALTRIYSRFAILEREVLIQQYIHITNYHLDKRFAVNNPDRPVDNFPYILDLPAEPFSDDAIKILVVRDYEGYELPLNDDTRSNSLFTPYPTILQIPNPDVGQIISCVYQALHEKLTFGVFDAEIAIPVVLEEALLSKVASYVYRDIATQESTVKGQEHGLNYESICIEIEQRDHASITSLRNNTKFNRNGFV